MACSGLSDSVQGYPARIAADGSLQVASQARAWEVSSNVGDDVGTTTAEIADAQSGRQYIRFTNNSTTTAVYIKPHATDDVTSNDTRIGPGESLEFHGGYAGKWRAISASGTVRISVVEFYV